MRVAVILPAYNERPSIPRLVQAIDRAMEGAGVDHRIILVDDGSTDGTAAAAPAHVRVIEHARNRGLGAALATGFDAALRAAESPGTIVTLDADGTQPPAMIPDLVEAVEGDHDVAIASRYVAGATQRGVPLIRRTASRLARAALRTLRPVRGVRDYTSGFRAYRAEALRRVAERFGPPIVTRAGFECQIELLLRLDATGARFCELPLVLEYDRKHGPSKMRLVRTAWGMITVACGAPSGRPRRSVSEGET